MATDVSRDGPESNEAMSVRKGAVAHGQSTFMKLMEFGQKFYQKAHALEQAQGFAEAAIEYRLAASDFKAAAELVKQRIASVESQTRIWESWARWRGDEIPPVWQDAGPIPSDVIKEAVLDEIPERDIPFQVVICLQDQLVSHGFEISSPGGSLQRHLWCMLREAFNGDVGRGYAELLKSVDVRVALEPIASEVIEIWRSKQG